MRLHQSNRQIDRRLKKKQARKDSRTEGTVHLGPNWSIGEDEAGQLFAHNVTNGKRVILATNDEEVSDA